MSTDARALIKATETTLDAIRAVTLCDALRRDEIRRMIDDTGEWSLNAVQACTESDRARLAELWASINHEVKKLDWVKPDTIVVRGVTISNDVELPKILTEAYELLWCESYGTGMISIGDPIGIHGTGKAFRGRWDSDQVETRAGATAKKKLSASQKNVIKNPRAYAEKIKIDKRLRQLGRDVEDFLNKVQKQPTWVMKCTKCRKMGEDDWKFCARCGNTMERSN